MSNFKIYSNAFRFIITQSSKVPSGYSEVKGDFRWLYGYVFGEKQIIKDRALSSAEYRYLRQNKDNLSGIFCIVGRIGEKISIQFDPLVQYNLFFAHAVGIDAVSNDMLGLNRIIDGQKFNDTFFYDSLPITLHCEVAP